MRETMKSQRQRTAVLYARFSSDLQKDRSVDDQLVDCEAYAKRLDLKVIERFSDRAKSGTTMHGRTGARELMLAVKARKFDVLIAESTSRVARDSEDLAGICKRLKHSEIEFNTVNQGVIDNMKAGLNGIIDSEFIKNLVVGIKRGQNGVVREGLFPGAVTYGYERVEVSPGIFKPGERVINKKQAQTIRRIFAEYANGTSPRKIAADLSLDGVPAPSGGTEWNHQSLTSGGGKTRGGILGNRLYIGELIWNQQFTVTDPDTGSASKRARPVSEHTVVAVPHMRIIDDRLWEAAQAVRESRSVALFGSTGKMTRRPVTARSEHLLAGLLRCGVCNGHMIISKMSLGKRFVMCAAAHQRSACSHSKNYVMDSLKGLVLDGMRNRLTDPEALTKAARAFHLEYAAQAKKDAVDRQAVEKQRNRLEIQIARLVAAISDSDEPLPALLEALKTKETERVGLEERLRQIKATMNVVTLHPNVIQDYRANVEKLHEALVRNPGAQANRQAFRNMIDSIVVHPTEYRAPYEVTVLGRLSAILGVDHFPTARSNAEIIAAEGFPRSDNGNPGWAALPLSQRGNDVISLGRWKAAA